MILPIKHKVDWKLIPQKNQTQINKDNIRKNRNQVDHDYKVGDKFTLNHHDIYKYETPYKGPFVITTCFTNGMVNIQYGLKKIKHIICRIKPYKYDTNVEDINPENVCDNVNL